MPTTQSIYSGFTPGQGYGSGSIPAGGLNQYGFKAQPVNDNSPMANFVQSAENLNMAGGISNVGQGQSIFGQGVNSLAPVLQYLTALTRGDQADLAQATQPQVNQIQDSFQAARNMISSQPRGGGKAGALAEAPYKQIRQVGDLQQGARSGAAGQLGNVANTLAGLGMNESTFGQSQQEMALSNAMAQRGQNVQERAALQQMIGQLGAAAGKVVAAGMGG